MSARDIRDMKVCEQLHVWGEALAGTEVEMQHNGWVLFAGPDGARVSLYLPKGSPLCGLMDSGRRPHAVIYCVPR
jgi:hypothetical protein